MEKRNLLPSSGYILAGLLRVFFKLLYHQFSWSYDLVAWVVSVGMWKRWILLPLPYLIGPNVLELGHGPGHLQLALDNRGICVVGLDESRQMGLRAYGGICRFGFVPLLVSGYAQFLPFPSDHFNQVVATFPSEYITDPSTLNDVMRVLHPGGLFVILPLAWLTGRRPAARLAAWLSRKTNQSPAWDNRMVEPFEAAGFQVQTEFLSERDSQAVLILAKKPGRSKY